MSSRLPSILLLLGGVVGLAACGAESRPARRAILITVDTLRFDRLGVNGYEADTTPHLDRFAKGALVFDRAYAAASFTLPALTSLMTGRLPDELGMVSNRVLVPAEVTTIAETVADAGIPTAAIVSNWVLRKQEEASSGGIEQGFAHYDDRMESTEANRSNVKERSATATTDAAIEWLFGPDAEGRFFLWVHYQDPHGPYTPPDRYLRTPTNAEAAGEPALRLGLTQQGFGELPNYQALGSERRPAVYRARYDAEIRYLDHELGRLFTAIEEADLLRDSLVLFSADHGESLGEHDYWFSHGQTLYDELVHVPLIVHYPDGLPRPTARRVGEYQRVETLVGHVDVPDTVLAALGLPRPISHGTSLAAAELPPDRLLAQQLRAPGAGNRWMSLTDGRWRLVADPEKLMLFDLENDPGETTNLIAREPERYRAMMRRYELMGKALPAIGSTGADRALTPEEEEELSKLGYGD